MVCTVDWSIFLKFLFFVVVVVVVAGVELG